MSNLPSWLTYLQTYAKYLAQPLLLQLKNHAERTVTDTPGGQCSDLLGVIGVMHVNPAGKTQLEILSRKTPPPSERGVVFEPIADEAPVHSV